MTLERRVRLALASVEKLSDEKLVAAKTPGFSPTALIRAGGQVEGLAWAATLLRAALEMDCGQDAEDAARAAKEI